MSCSTKNSSTGDKPSNSNVTLSTTYVISCSNHSQTDGSSSTSSLSSCGLTPRSTYCIWPLNCSSHSLISNKTCGHSPMLIRGCLLFGMGMFFSLILHLVQYQRRVLLDYFSSDWWVPLACGAVAAFIGLLYPCVDRKLGALPHSCEWSSVVRCVALFVGINHATAKITYENSIQLSLSLAVMGLGLWYVFDGSRAGFGLCIVIAMLATAISQLLVDQGLFITSDFLYTRSWLPPIFFSGTVTMGLIGRQLAKSDSILEWQKMKLE